MPKLVQRSYSSLGIILHFFTALIVSPPLWLFFDNSLFNVFARYILCPSRRNWEFNFHELLWKYRLAAAPTCTIVMRSLPQISERREPCCVAAAGWCLRATCKYSGQDKRENEGLAGTAARDAVAK